MNWLSNITPPGIKNLLKRQNDNPDTLWIKCAGCGEMVFHRDLEAAQKVCPACGFHMRLSVNERFDGFFDNKTYDLIELPEAPADPLKFKDEKKYSERLKEYRKRTGQNDALLVAAGAVEGSPVVAAIQDFSFMGGSMGTALGEAFVTAAQEAIARKAALVVFSASGGARMQEGILSLMQMPRTTVAIEMLKDEGLPYIVVLTNPTTGGVTASYAMLGDVNIAEPGALIGFAGARVIEQTIREKLPEGFQRAEFLKEKGMVDMVVERAEVKSAIGRLLRVLNSKSALESVVEAGEESKQDETVVEIAENQALDKAAE